MPGVLHDALARIVAAVSAERLTREIEAATGRISELVRAIKEYSYMDQLPEQEIDIHQGIESTLTMLKFRLKKGVNVIREYDKTLPQIFAHGSELNQVWTNLIDNAIDAMGGKGELTHSHFARVGYGAGGNHRQRSGYSGGREGPHLSSRSSPPKKSERAPALAWTRCIESCTVITAKLRLSPSQVKRLSKCGSRSTAQRRETVTLSGPLDQVEASHRKPEFRARTAAITDPASRSVSTRKPAGAARLELDRPPKPPRAGASALTSARSRFLFYGQLRSTPVRC